jgi:hypothetical protein
MPGAIIGDGLNWSGRVNPLLVLVSGGKAACRSRDGARCRGGYLGEGSPMGGSGGLFEVGLGAGPSSMGELVVSMCSWAGRFVRSDPKPLFATCG